MLSLVKPVLALALALIGAGAARAEIVRPEPDDNLQWAAAVEQLTPLRNQGDLGLKLFGAAGGDPAMNGLHTYLAFFDSPGDGWRLFKIGDFLSYRLVAQAPGRLTLEIRESVMNQRTTEIGSRTRRLTVSWTAPADGSPPATVNVTPAR